MDKFSFIRFGGGPRELGKINAMTVAGGRQKNVFYKPDKSITQGILVSYPFLWLPHFGISSGAL